MRKAATAAVQAIIEALLIKSIGCKCYAHSYIFLPIFTLTYYFLKTSAVGVNMVHALDNLMQKLIEDETIY
ncbi:MAG: hypothetical protein ACR2KZ_07050, partial [Segetibacter sp.]